MLKKILLLTNILLIGIFVYVMYLIYFPFKTIEFKDKQFKVISKEIKSGDKVIYETDYCKYVDVPSTVSKSFVNDFVYATTPTVTNRPKGCGKVKVIVPIPEELPAGKYYLLIKYTYHVNPLRTITKTMRTDYFVVEEVEK